MNEPDRPEPLIPPPEQSGSGEDIGALGPADFQRIGLQPRETRLAVIRRAASRTAKSLARRQLDSPNPLTERQLSAIAVSTYRVLDPRQRDDRQSRAHVGRIRPGALLHAARTSFAKDAAFPGRKTASDATADGVATQAARVANDSSDSEPRTRFEELSQNTDRLGVHRDDINRQGINLQPGPLVANHHAEKQGLVDRVRRQAHRPGLILLMIALLLSSAAGLWAWGQ